MKHVGGSIILLVFYFLNRAIKGLKFYSKMGGTEDAAILEALIRWNSVKPNENACVALQIFI